MKSTAAQTVKKRPVNLLLSEKTVSNAREYTSNLSATVDSLLTDYIYDQEQTQLSKQKTRDKVSKAWNQFHEAHGSYADEYSTL